MGCCVSNNVGSMYGFTFVYRKKYIKKYRYIVYSDVQFTKPIHYEDGREVTNYIAYPFVVNDMYTGKFLFTDEYNIPLLSTSPGNKNTHTLNTDISSIVSMFDNYLMIHDNPYINPPAYNPSVKLIKN